MNEGRFKLHEPLPPLERLRLYYSIICQIFCFVSSILTQIAIFLKPVCLFKNLWFYL